MAQHDPPSSARATEIGGKEREVELMLRGHQVVTRDPNSLGKRSVRERRASTVTLVELNVVDVDGVPYRLADGENAEAFVMACKAAGQGAPAAPGRSGPTNAVTGPKPDSAAADAAGALFGVSAGLAVVLWVVAFFNANSGRSVFNDAVDRRGISAPQISQVSDEFFASVLPWFVYAVGMTSISVLIGLAWLALKPR